MTTNTNEIPPAEVYSTWRWISPAIPGTLNCCPDWNVLHTYTNGFLSLFKLADGTTLLGHSANFRPVETSRGETKQEIRARFPGEMAMIESRNKSQRQQLAQRVGYRGNALYPTSIDFLEAIQKFFNI